jgi:hypothetical protein
VAEGVEEIEEGRWIRGFLNDTGQKLAHAFDRILARDHRGLVPLSIEES